MPLKKHTKYRGMAREPFISKGVGFGRCLSAITDLQLLLLEKEERKRKKREAFGIVTLLTGLIILLGSLVCSLLGFGTISFILFILAIFLFFSFIFSILLF